MDILIAGAGIGGLVTALSLRAAGFDRIQVLESAATLRPEGVGLNILPSAVRELAELGLDATVAAHAVATRELAFYTRSGQLIWTEPRGLAAGYRWPQLSLPRRHLQQVLLDAVRQRLGSAAVRTDARVHTFAPLSDDRLRVVLSDRSTVTTDLLIGADGIHSAVRAAMYPGEGDPPSNGMLMYRGMAWADPFLTGATMVVAGDDVRRAVFYPVDVHHDRGGRVLVNWVIGVPADPPTRPGPTQRADWRRTAASPDHVHAHVAGWRLGFLDIHAVLRQTERIYVYPMVDREPLPRWTHGRATLLGDAAHAMYPMGSNGATQAIIDARVIAHALATHDIEHALAAYEQRRRPAMTALQASNREHGPEAAISIVHRRAPDGFTRLDEVISARELQEISQRYASTAGFDVRTVNEHPSWSVP